MTQRLAVLGSTGSVGRQALDVVRDLPGQFRVVGLAGGTNHTLLEDQAREFKPDLVWCQNADRHMHLKAAAGARTRWTPLDEMAAHPDVDLVLVATSGMAGLAPTLAALAAGKSVASLKGAGSLIVLGATFQVPGSRNLHLSSASWIPKSRRGYRFHEPGTWDPAPRTMSLHLLMSLSSIVDTPPAP